MSLNVDARIERLARDRESGASELLDEAMAILETALTSGHDVAHVARALCRAQPSMAPMWNAAGAALASERDPGRFARFAQRVARAPDALARFALELLRPAGRPGAPVRLVTLSYSRSVIHVIERLGQEMPVRVACAESRPALEGRRLAARLAGTGIPVTLCLDAALAHALAEADAVCVGADAVSPSWFLNKSGTRMLAAAAERQGVPVYVLASRDKFVGAAVASRLKVREGPTDEVWPEAPAAVEVLNPYFERIPLDLAAAIVTDSGVIGPADAEKLSNIEYESLLIRLDA